MPFFGPHSGDRAGAVDGWFAPARTVGYALVRRARGRGDRARRRRLHRERPRGRASSSTAVRGSASTSAWTASTARSKRDALSPTGVRRAHIAHNSPTTDPMPSTTGRSAPRWPGRCRPRGVTSPRRTSRDTRGVVRSVRGALPRPRHPRAPATDPGRDRARGAAHPRRFRGIRRPRRAHAPPDRDPEGGAGRPGRVDLGSRAHAGAGDRALRRRLRRARRAAIDPDRRPIRARTSAARWHRVPVRRRRRRADDQPHPVELRRVRLGRVRARVGDQPPQPGWLVLARRRPRQRVRARQAAAPHPHPRARAPRRGTPAVVFGTMGGDAQAQVHVQLPLAPRRRRLRTPRGAQRSAVAARSLHLESARRVSRATACARQRPRRTWAPAFGRRTAGTRPWATRT